mgnify:CR=1 FL=1
MNLQEALLLVEAYLVKLNLLLFLKIKEVMQHIGRRDFPWFSENSDISEGIKLAVRFPNARLVYVIDDQKKQLGVITIGSLMRHLYPYHYKEKIHPRDILRNIVVYNASHLMGIRNVKALPEVTVDVGITPIARTRSKAIAMVACDGCILAYITGVDLLKHSD